MEDTELANKQYDLDKQHAKGKLHAIERIELLLDKNSFTEIGNEISGYGHALHPNEKLIPYDGVITGYGTVNKQRVFVYSQDFTVVGGSLAMRHGYKIANTIRLAIQAGCPVIGVFDSGGARIQEGVIALAGCSEMLYYDTMASGSVPHISVVVGPCAGASAYAPSISDFVFIVDKIGQLFVTGPNVVKSVTNEDVTIEELGGGKIHSSVSGVAHFCYDNEKDCLSDVRKLVDILPSSYVDSQKNKINELPKYERKLISTGIGSIIPENERKAYDIHDVINAVFDKGSFIEVSKDFAMTMVTGFAKLSGITVGIIANQPLIKAGIIDCDASDKAARLVRYCDAYDIPIVTFVDTPGYMPGREQEHKGLIRHGAKLVYAYAEATTLKLTVVLRKAYGGAYIAMSSRNLRADFIYAWPTAELAVMGADGAVAILYKKKAKAIEDEAERKKYMSDKLEEYKAQFSNARIALEEGLVDELIQPEETRAKLYSAISIMRNKQNLEVIPKKHGNIPL